MPFLVTRDYVQITPKFSDVKQHSLAYVHNFLSQKTELATTEAAHPV